MDRLKIGHLNVHNEARATSWMLAQNCDSLGLNEANQRLALLRARVKYRVHVGFGGRDKRRGASEVPVITSKRYPSLGMIAMQVSEQSTPTKFAPDRWVTCSLFSHPIGAVAHVNLHPNALTRDRPTSVPRVRETAELWESVDALLTFLEHEQFRIVVSGDLNSPRSDKTPGYAGAYDVFEKHQLKTISEGVDAIAYDRKLRVVQRRIVPRKTTGSDHPGIIAIFGRNS